MKAIIQGGRALQCEMIRFRHLTYRIVPTEHSVVLHSSKLSQEETSLSSQYTRIEPFGWHIDIYHSHLVVFLCNREASPKGSKHIPLNKEHKMGGGDPTTPHSILACPQSPGTKPGAELTVQSSPSAKLQTPTQVCLQAVPLRTAASPTPSVIRS